MASYTIRDLPDGLIARVKQRADETGWPMRALILRLFEDFAAGRIHPTGAPPPRPESRDS